MNVGPSHLSVLPSSIGKGPQQTSQNSKDSAASDKDFSSIFGSANGDHSGPTETRMSQSAPERAALAYSSLEAGLSFFSSERGYTLHVNIGDDAVSFDARPIVGPSATGPLANLTIGEPASDGGIAPSVTPGAQGLQAAVNLERLDPEPEFRRQGEGLKDVASRTAKLLGDAAPAAIVQSQPGVVGAQKPGPATLSQSTQPRPHTKAHIAPEQPVAKPTSAQLSPQLQARAQLFAQLVASASEYRVTTRGLQLSQTEQERLAKDIRTALRSYGLADLPVVLTSQTGVG